MSPEAIRWLSDIKASYLQIDADGRVLAAFGSSSGDRPSLRRAQAMAGGSAKGLDLARDLVRQKIEGQLTILARFDSLLSTAPAIGAVGPTLNAVAAAQSIPQLMHAEASAAMVYWQALTPIGVRFAHRDVDSVPAHWRTFGRRASPLSSGPRLAANPANAMLNCGYALLEGAAVVAARAVGSILASACCRSATRRVQRAAELAWERDHPEPGVPAYF